MNNIKQVPHSKIAEESVIGCMLIDSEKIDFVSDKLVQSDFYYTYLGIIFKEIVDMYKADKWDLSLLKNKLKSSKELAPEFSSDEFLSNLVGNISTTFNIELYVDEVKKASILRKFIKELQIIIDKCCTPNEDKDNIIEYTDQKLFNLLNIEEYDNDLESIKDIVIKFIEKMEKAYSSDGNEIELSTGFLDLDKKLNGLHKSDLILVASRPSMGKTSFAINIMRNISIVNKKPVVIFSLEMTKEQIVSRLFGVEGGINLQRLKSGKLTDDEYDKLADISKKISDANIIIYDNFNLTISKLRRLCRLIKMKYKDLGLVIIDYLQLMNPDNTRKSDNRQQEISEISRGLKQAARELDVPILALSQLSRLPEQRSDHRPMMSDLRESGAIEQDADIVMFLYRDVVYNKDVENKNDCEIIIGKHRNGPTGTVKLTWLEEYTQFKNQISS